MRRWRVLLLAFLLVVAGTAVPLVVAAYLSWRTAVAAQESRLERAADQTLAHAGGLFTDASQTLRELSLTDLPRCSPEHMAQMRELTINSLATENLGFIRDGVVLCNVWGPAQLPIPRAPTDILLPDGMGVSINFHSVFNPRHPMMVLHLGDYTAMIDQKRFIAPASDRSVQVEIRTPNGVLLQTDWEHATAPSPQTENELLVTREAAGWTVLARQPRIGFYGYLRTIRGIFIPVAAILAALFSALAIWALRRRLSPRGELALAVRNGEFITHYQPIIELATSRCVGAEALVRWNRPDGSLVRPDLFIPLAEDTGLIQPITDQVIAAVIADLGDLLRQDRHLHVSINLCPADISTGRILPVLKEALEGTGVENQQIWLEATERGFVDIEGARHTLAELRRRGHMTAIDDFGTGYSGLKYLQRLPVDALKIDKSFVDAVGTEAPTSHVTEHIIQMAGELRLRIVAEGVESETQANYLRQRGVDLAQGWLFSRALPADGFIAYCRANREAHGTPSNIATLAAE
ncbi:EAL domain-containing protein [Ancylobacter sp. VNQ12]|uniref:EAL domain-containing protein n=1 Tax=Ancylobacter sp. VNQ12 TaxID=3400920 RepID=UPI003C01534F